ncbi:transglutaminase domain-containing protein [Confluentibacter lentus]|uniref:transglutaminase domain-containing protein n=1 Tax=Confluentibacter lentus TaxID=1699412 RepID=UPI000C283499|nr:transglutaminase domain-containing protein [Confluentibacter lentus]
MKKNILLFFVLLFNVSLLLSQNNYDKFWDELLNNQRKSAGALLEKVKKDDIQSLVINEIFREETGFFTENNDFTDKFLLQEDFEYYLYALWNKSYVFDTYLETGFNLRNKGVLDKVLKTPIRNTDIKDALNYLSAVVNRENNDWKSYFALNDSINSIKDWQYCGVFENLNESGLDKVYDPELKAVSEIPFDAKSNGFVNWYSSKNTKEAYQFFLNHMEYGAGVNYAQTFISAVKDEQVIIRIGSGSAFKMWLNDVLIYENPEDVITDLNAYKVKVTIPKGENRLLIKCAESGSISYFITSILDENGIANKSLKYSSQYKEYNKSTVDIINPKVIDNQFEAYFINKTIQNPDNFFYAYCLANTFLRSSKYQEAKNVLEPYSKKFPKSSLIRKMLIQAYLLEGDNTSYNELKKNIELDDPDYYLPLVLKVADYNDLARMSLEDLNVFLDKFKKTVNHEVMGSLADFIYNARKEDIAAVRKDIDNLLMLSKGNIKLQLRFAPLYSTLFKEDDKTIELLEDINSNFFDYTAISTLSNYYSKQNKKDKVLKILSKDQAFLSNDNTYLVPIIKKLQTYQDYKQSLDYINLALENFPYSFELLELKGDALNQLGEKKKAIESYESSLKHDSANSALRKKIKDLKNEPNLLNDITLADAYSFIEKNRSKITTNNYGYNVLIDDTNIELYTEGGGKYRFVTVYEITSNNGVESFKEYNLGLTGNYHITKSEIVKATGSIIPADKSGSNLVFNGLSIGDVVYIDYEGSFSSVGRFYKDYTDDFMLDSFHPTVKTSLKIIVPKDLKLNHKVLNGTLEPKISKLGSSDLYEWTLENLPGMPQEEDYMPNSIDVARYLHVSTIPNWNEIAIWYSDLVRSSIEVDETVKSVFNKLFPNGYKQFTEEEKAKTIYNYIKNNFTYSYVSFKQSGFIPQKPSKTIKTNLGDCKDFSTLFVTLANMAELQSNLVLILTSDNGQNSLVLPSTDFNHCIVKVKLDGQERFLELTDKFLPFKSLPLSLRGATGLEIPFNSDTNVVYDLMKLDNVLREESVFKNDVSIHITNDIKMEIKSAFTGHINSFYASILDDPNADVVKKAVYNDLDGQILEEFILDELVDIERIDDDKEIRYTSKITLDKKINKIGSINIFQLPIVSNPYTNSVISLDKRHYPIEYNQYENIDEYFNNYDVYIDASMSFVEIPESKKITFKNHLYEITYLKVAPNHLQVKIHAKPTLENILAEDYADFKTYIKSVLEAQKEFIGYK